MGIDFQQLWELNLYNYRNYITIVVGIFDKHYFCLKNNIRIAIISKKVSKIKPTDFEQNGRLKCLLLNTKREKSNNFLI